MVEHQIVALVTRVRIPVFPSFFCRREEVETNSVRRELYLEREFSKQLELNLSENSARPELQPTEGCTSRVSCPNISIYKYTPLLLSGYYTVVRKKRYSCFPCLFPGMHFNLTRLNFLGRRRLYHTQDAKRNAHNEDHVLAENIKNMTQQYNIEMKSIRSPPV